jgi:hypothetical protein
MNFKSIENASNMGGAFLNMDHVVQYGFVVMVGNSIKVPVRMTNGKTHEYHYNSVVQLDKDWPELSSIVQSWIDQDIEGRKG